MVSTVTYVSTLHGSISRSQLDGLLESSRDRNVEAGITGLLLVRDRQVIQILEGEDSQVRDLYARIRQDPRHRDVTQVWRSSSLTRRFPDWSMGFEDLQEASTDSVHSVSGPEASAGTWPRLDGDQRTFLNRRIALLRRGLANGNRLISALSVILDAHDAETVEADGSVRLRCRQGCTTDQLDVPGYPCFTALNAFWSLDATL